MANYMNIKGTTQQQFAIGAGAGKFSQIFNTGGLSGDVVWNLPPALGSTGEVLTVNSSGHLSWASPGAVTISGVIIGDQDLGLLSEIITARVDFGLASDTPYSIMNLGVL